MFFGSQVARSRLQECRVQRRDPVAVVPALNEPGFSPRDECYGNALCAI